MCGLWRSRECLADGIQVTWLVVVDSLAGFVQLLSEQDMESPAVTADLCFHF
jgi:hypothetical protein